MNLREIIKRLKSPRQSGAARNTPATIQESKERPDFCVIEVNHRCMFACQMCSYWQSGPDPEETSVDDLRNFVSSLKDFIPTPFEMNLSGGEPLLKEGIFDLVEYIGSRDIRFSLVTNGYLVNQATAQKLAHSGLTVLAISLDSVNERVHDVIRGRAGAYQRIMQAIGYLNQDRGRLDNIVIQAIIMQPNLEGLLDLVKWAGDNRLSLSFMAVCRPNTAPADTQWYKKEEFSFLWPQDTGRVHAVLDQLIDLKAKGYKIDNPVGQLEKFKLYFADPEKFVKETPCSLGEKIIHVNHHGDIYLCCEMDSVGNIKKDAIGTAWLSPKAGEIREKIRLCKKNCAGMVNCYREEPQQP